MVSRTSALATSVAITGIFALLLSGCSNATNSNSPASPSSKVNSAAAELLPDSISSRGELNIATFAQIPPLNFKTDDGKLTGLDNDLSNEVATRLGLVPKYSDVAFESVIPGLQSGRYDVAFSGITNTEERQKIIDFVDYFESGYTMITKSEFADKYKSLDDLCGQTVAEPKGTVQAALVEGHSKTCPSGEQINILEVTDNPAVILQLQTGRIEVAVVGLSAAAWASKQSAGKYKLTGSIMQRSSAGAGFAKSADGNKLRDAVHLVLLDMAKDGTYSKLLEKYGLNDGALPTFPES
jgi:polar amino acid transport system substrate-binding protein